MATQNDLAEEWQKLSIVERVDVLIDAYHTGYLHFIEPLPGLRYARVVAQYARVVVQDDGWKFVPPKWWVGKGRMKRYESIEKSETVCRDLEAAEG